MADKPHNKKIPKGPQQDKRAEPEYPWVSGYSDVNGHYKLKYADPDKPEKSYIEEVYHHGGFKINETNDGEGIKSELQHHVRKYSQSTHMHNDGPFDVMGSLVSTIANNEFGIQAGSNLYRGAGGSEIAVSKNTSKTRMGTEGSKQQNFRSSSGDESALHEGNKFAFYGKDYGLGVDGTFYGMYKSDHGSYVGGNFDTHADKKLRLYSEKAWAANTADTMNLNSKKELTISSDQKIVIKVGSSKIEISDGQITITGSQIKFEQG